MNDEASSSTAAPLNTPHTTENDGGSARAREGDDTDGPKKRLHKELLQRLDELLLAFDVIIYAELASLYYMEYVVQRCLSSDGLTRLL